jgi:hypothetical protein
LLKASLCKAENANVKGVLILLRNPIRVAHTAAREGGYN